MVVLITEIELPTELWTYKSVPTKVAESGSTQTGIVATTALVAVSMTDTEYPRLFMT